MEARRLRLDIQSLNKDFKGKRSLSCYQIAQINELASALAYTRLAETLHYTYKLLTYLAFATKLLFKVLTSALSTERDLSRL